MVLTFRLRPPLPMRPSRLFGPQRPLLCEMVSGKSLSREPLIELNFTSVLTLGGTSRSMEPLTVLALTGPPVEPTPPQQALP